MRKVLLIALNSLTRTARDKKTLMLMLAMPMILIGILGSALQGLMSETPIQPFDVLVVNADQPAKPPLPQGAPPAAAEQLPSYHFGKILVEDVLRSEQAGRILKVVDASDPADARAQVAAAKAPALVYLPATFTADLLAGKPVSVQVVTDAGRPTQAEIVRQIVSAFTEEVSAGRLAAVALGPERAALLTGDAVRAAAATVKEAPSGLKSVSAIQYYAAAMGIMFMVMTALSRAKDLILERQDGTLHRMLASPTGKGTILAGQALGTLVIVMAQFLTLMAGTSLIYQVDWGPLLPALLIGFAFCVASAGIGTATAAILNDPKAADAAVGVVANVFAALSGSMFPLWGFSEPMKLIAKFTPNYWALQAFIDQMSGAGTARLWTPILILVTLGLVSGAVGTWRLADNRR